jgi:multiple sugar transport system ATP-binding protein
VDGQMVFEEGRLENARFAGGADDDLTADELVVLVVLVGELTLPGNGFHLPVPARLRDCLAGQVGRHVVLGVRPEHLHAKPTGGEGECCPLAVRVNVIEPLGNSMDVYVQTALKEHVVARLEAQGGLQADSAMTLYADLRRIHFFEPGMTGQNLGLFEQPAIRPSSVG